MGVKAAKQFLSLKKVYFSESNPLNCQGMLVISLCKKEKSITGEKRELKIH